MSLIEIGFLIIGVLCLVISFFLSEKLSSSDLGEIKRMSEKEINVIIEREMKEAEVKIAKLIDGKIDSGVDSIDIRTDKQTNDKIMAIEEYANPVLESIEQSQKQVLFMYDRLNEKQEKLSNLSDQIQKAEQSLRNIKEGIEKQYETLKTDGIAVQEVPITPEVPEEDAPKSSKKEKSTKNSSKKKAKSKTEDSIEEALQKEINSQKSGDNQNDKILQLHKEGADDIEIAKKLGIGLGEVKLVLGLFNED